MDNSMNLNASQGAGIQAGRNVVELGVEAVVTGHVGPGRSPPSVGRVGVYTGASGTVAEAVEQFKAGALMRQDGADVEGTGYRRCVYPYGDGRFIATNDTRH